jgi:hypothetical protein
MAGNGFAFVKVYDLTMEHTLISGWLVALSVVSFLGVAIAYAVLWRPTHDRWAKIGEYISANCVLYAVAVWNGFIVHLTWL